MFLLPSGDADKTGFGVLSVVCCSRKRHWLSSVIRERVSRPHTHTQTQPGCKNLPDLHLLQRTCAQAPTTQHRPSPTLLRAHRHRHGNCITKPRPGLMALRLSVKLTAGNPPSGASLHIQDQRVGDGYMAADGEFPLQQPKRTTAATPAMHRGAIMKMYDRQ